MRVDIEEVVFGVPMDVVVGKNSEIVKLIRSEHGTDAANEWKMDRGKDSGMSELLLDKDGMMRSYVWLPSFNPNDTDDIGTLWHECLHIAENVLADRQVRCVGTNEALAYLQEHYARTARNKIIEAMEKQQ